MIKNLIFLNIILATQPMYATGLINLVSTSPLCEKNIQFENSISGAILVNFTDISVSRTDKKPYIRCRFAAQLSIPQGMTTSNKTSVVANIVGEQINTGDQIGGRLALSVDKLDARDTAMTSRDDAHETARINLQVAWPKISACVTEKIVNVYFMIEAMINYRLDKPSTVTAKFETLSINPVELNLATCKTHNKKRL